LPAETGIDIEDLFRPMKEKTLLEALPPCLLTVVKHGRALGHLKHDDRFRVAAQFRALGARTPELLFSFLAGHDATRSLPDQKMSTNIQHELKQEPGDYLLECHQIARAQFAPDNVLACPHEGNRQACSGCDLPFDSPAGLLAKRLMKQQGVGIATAPQAHV
jgi:hypothetical protein